MNVNVNGGLPPVNVNVNGGLPPVAGASDDGGDGPLMDTDGH